MRRAGYGAPIRAKMKYVLHCLENQNTSKSVYGLGVEMGIQRVSHKIHILRIGVAKF
jgi:hypothetical protein